MTETPRPARRMHQLRLGCWKMHTLLQLPPPWPLLNSTTTGQTQIGNRKLYGIFLAQISISHSEVLTPMSCTGSDVRPRRPPPPAHAFLRRAPADPQSCQSRAQATISLTKTTGAPPIYNVPLAARPIIDTTSHPKTRQTRQTPQILHNQERATAETWKRHVQGTRSKTEHGRTEGALRRTSIRNGKTLGRPH